ncbi:MAG: hypothetical protein ACHREM_14595 [Polyangiales bacterium]
MHKSLAAFALTALASLGISACSDHHHHGDGGAWPSGSGGSTSVDCTAYTSCGDCTPVLGCGWCDYGGGYGECASGPSQCTAQEFNWTWDTAGCGLSTPIDAGTVAVDAATSIDAAASVDAATATDTSPPACLTPTDVGAGCAMTIGGALCGYGEYTVGCHGAGAGSAPSPSAALACLATSASSSAADQYFCCPCLVP